MPFCSAFWSPIAKKFIAISWGACPLGASVETSSTLPARRHTPSTTFPPLWGLGGPGPWELELLLFPPQTRPLGGLFSLTKAQIHVDPGPPSPQVQITWGPPPPQEDPPLYLGFSSATVAALATRGDGDKCLSPLPGETPVNHGLLSGGPPASWVPRPSTYTFLLPVPLLLVPFPLDTQKLLVLP